jgi:rifampicin phosphotransferase
VQVVHDLKSLSRNDLAVAGGKGANLGELIRLGMPVPPGFVVSAEAYAEQVRTWGLVERLAPHLEARIWDAAAAEAMKIVEEGALLPVIESSVRDAYRRLGAEYVAVRSSATAEDLVDASFAGQHETFLNITGEDAALRALRHCWASLWNSRALAYRDARKIEHATVNIAVVVQRMVPADFAGVLFTFDPVAQRADRLLIEVAPGLGEAIVSGHTTGDVYRVERAPRVVSQPVRTDQLALVEREHRDPRRPQPSDALLLQLCRQALELEKHFGVPQDIEFAFAKGSLFFLQSRPITTLESADIEPIAPLPTLSRLQKKMLETNDNDRFPQAFKPMDFHFPWLVFSMILGMAKDFGFAIDEVQMQRLPENPWMEFLIPPIAGPTPRLLRMPFQVAKYADADYLAWWEAEAYPRLLEVTAQVDLRALEDEELSARYDRLIEVFQSVIPKRFQGISTQLAGVVLGPLVRLAVGSKRAGVVQADLLSGIVTRTSEVNLALYELAQKAQRIGAELTEPIRRQSPEELEQSEVGRAFLADVETFLDEHGHRESVGLYLSTPTWRNDPKPFWGMLHSMLEAQHPPSEAAGYKRYEAALEEVTHKLRWVPGAANKVRSLVHFLRQIIVFRERSHYDMVRVVSALQGIAAETGRRLTERGLLPNGDDVYYLVDAEARAWLRGGAPAKEEAHKLIKRRRATYRLVNARWKKHLSHEPAVQVGKTNEIRGIGASSGTVRARARIILDESQFGRLQAGEVLVCRYTNPAWTPLFTVASAVITDVGGAASHAAIVAREYGLPAVLGALGATERIKDGDEIIVDGATGIVTLAQRSTAAELAHG